MGARPLNLQKVIFRGEAIIWGYHFQEWNYNSKLNSKVVAGCSSQWRSSYLKIEPWRLL